MGIKFFLDDVYQLQCVHDENFIHAVCVLMDSVDDSPFPLWPTDEPGMEEIDTAGIGEYDYYSGGDIVVEEVMISRKDAKKNTKEY